jgi:hypothetical protein
LVAKKAKVPVYEPLEEELSAETAFLQAATALDIAAMWAVESKDTQSLGSVAQSYIELGTRLMGPPPDEAEEHDLTSESEFGFVPVDLAAAREVEHGRTSRQHTAKARASRWRIPRVHKEHGEL